MYSRLSGNAFDDSRLRPNLTSNRFQLILIVLASSRGTVYISAGFVSDMLHLSNIARQVPGSIEFVSSSVWCNQGMRLLKIGSSVMVAASDLFCSLDCLPIHCKSVYNEISYI